MAAFGPNTASFAYAANDGFPPIKLMLTVR